MAIIKVPKEVAVSPQDGSELRFDTETRDFYDFTANMFSVDEIAASRPGNKVRKWVNENYPAKR